MIPGVIWGMIITEFIRYGHVAKCASILHAGSTIQRKAHLEVTTQDEAGKYKDKCKKVTGLGDLGRTISTFITVSMDAETSSSNRDARCRAFTEGVKQIPWDRFVGDSGT